MYYKSGILIDLSLLEKIADDGQPKPRVKIIDSSVVDKIKATTDAIRQAYNNMVEQGKTLCSENLQRETDVLLHHSSMPTRKPETVKERFDRYISESFENDVFGSKRKAACEVMSRTLSRFLRIVRREQITASEFGSEMVVSLSNFIRNEFEYVSKWEHLYETVKKRDIPTEQRKDSTVAARMKIIRAFFSMLYQRGEISKTPFDSIDKNTKKSMLREIYDTPISLTLSELDKIRKADIPEELCETRLAFLLQCATGCRIGDFTRLTMENVDIDDGIPFVHYLPRKTATQCREEIITPLVPFAVDIIRENGFSFKILRNISGKDGFSVKIKNLLKHCKIDRACVVYDENKKMGIRKPLYELASSKIARKTFVNLCASCQVDMYAAGLHSRGSKAVERYAHISLQERYKLLCYAFGGQAIKVDEELRPVAKQEKTNRVSEILKGLSSEERKELLEFLTNNP